MCSSAKLYIPSTIKSAYAQALHISPAERFFIRAAKDWISQNSVMLGRCQKVAKFDFQSQFSMSKIIRISLIFFFIEEYKCMNTFFVIDLRLRNVKDILNP